MDNTSKPAAPCIEEQQHSGAGTQFFYSPGLTKLEYAAIQIMAGLVSNNNLTGRWDEYAVRSVGAARALFAELEKEQ